MKRMMLLLLTLALTTGCAARREDTRAADLQRKYAGMAGCEARVAVSAAEDGEVRRYTLDLVRDGTETRVTAVEPEELAGVCVVVAEDRRAIVCGDLLLDAGSVGDGLSAANAADVVLYAAAEGWITEQNDERFGDTDALRLCFETEQGGEPLSVAAWFDASDAPLYAEIERGGKILLYLEFTEFVFRDIVGKD